MASTDAERAARYRYAKRLQKTADKLYDLLKSAPPKYKEDYRLLPFDIDFLLFDCVSEVLNTPVEFIGEGDRIGVRFMLEMEYPSEAENAEAAEEALDYQYWKKAMEAMSLAAKAPAALKMTRNAFCEQVLEAKLANSRWGWVGVKEGSEGQPGSLYLFGWEHNKGCDGEGTVGFFHKEVGVDGNGRKRPGHRDALEKIERVQSGELKPFVVWQKADDPAATVKKIESINGVFVSECDLYIDDKGYWTGRIGDQKSIQGEDQ